MHDSRGTTLGSGIATHDAPAQAHRPPTVSATIVRPFAPAVLAIQVKLCALCQPCIGYSTGLYTIHFKRFSGPEREAAPRNEVVLADVKMSQMKLLEERQTWTWRDRNPGVYRL